jgi:hypothetical protein
MATQATEDESEDSEEYDLDADYIYDKPIDVSMVSGGLTGDSIHIKETHADGSHTTNTYTEEQGRKLLNRLKDIYDECPSEGEDE